MQRMNVVLDREALEQAKRLTGKKNYSETINHLIAEAVRQDELGKAIDAIAADPDFWSPGYVEEQAPDVAHYLKQQKGRRRTAAHTARAPVDKAVRRGSR
jgi:uncharacterized Fe-S cluster-containing radical SAM superfamily enzyme